MTTPLQRFAGMSVLAVDDNADNLSFLRILLQRRGLVRVHTEQDPRRVLERVRLERPDLVLLDLHMPNLDGFQVLEQIQQIAAGRYLPVLVLTADTTTEARNRALAAGADDFLTKPLDATETTLRIANLLRTKELYTSLRGERSWERSSVEQSEVEKRIRGSLDTGGPSIVFQPVVRLDTSEVVGHEALSRFPGEPNTGPAHWFHDAFSVGLGVELEWQAATSALPYLDSARPDWFLAVNMSPATVLHMVDNDLCTAELCPRVVIELTEHVPVENYDAVHRALQEIRSHGARLSADDLGSGYAGFRHLVRLRPDLIKLDISLVTGIHHNREQRALARALLAFAADVGAIVIAEGIEEEAELDVLRDLGVPWGQGYLLGYPEPAVTADA